MTGGITFDDSLQRLRVKGQDLFSRQVLDSARHTLADTDNALRLTI